MKIRLLNENYEIRVQQRVVTQATILKSGKVVAHGTAWLNPMDKNDEEIGARIAVGRATQELRIYDKAATPRNRPLTTGERKGIVGKVVERIRENWARKASRQLQEVFQRLEEAKVQEEAKDWLERGRKLGRSYLRVAQPLVPTLPPPPETKSLRSRFIEILGLEDE
jgi:ABC-type uncharacterized transport system ATPase subunit